MAEHLENCSKNADASYGAPSDVKSDISTVRCGCGAGPHAINPDRCARGHQLPGVRSIAAKLEPLSAVDQAPIPEGASSFEIALQRRNCALAQVRAQESRLAAPLTDAKRRAEQRVLDAFLETLQRAQLDVERLAPTAPPGPQQTETAVDSDPLSVDEWDLLVALINKAHGREDRFDCSIEFGPIEWPTFEGEQQRYRARSVRLVWRGEVGEKYWQQERARRGITYRDDQAAAKGGQFASFGRALLTAGQGDVGSHVGNTMVNADDIATE